jgi:hypothetical protein
MQMRYGYIPSEMTAVSLMVQESRVLCIGLSIFQEGFSDFVKFEFIIVGEHF